jgi:hypothetical protein
MELPKSALVAVGIGVLGFFVIEGFVWWPKSSAKTASNEVSSSEQGASPAGREKSWHGAGTAPAAMQNPANPGAPGEVQLAPDPGIAAKIQGLEAMVGCNGKFCGTPCTMRCNPGGGSCMPEGFRPGECTKEGECSYKVPADCK